MVEHQNLLHFGMALPVLSMARILTALLAAAALLAVGHSATPEEYWRTVLPDSPLPEAILRLLHPETKAHGSNEHTSSVSSDDILAKKMSTFPLIYYMPRIAALYEKIAQGKFLSHPMPAVVDNPGHETKAHGSVEGSSSVSSDDILARKMSTFPLIYYMPRIAALYDKIAQEKKAHGFIEGSSSVSSDDILARKMSTFPLIYYMPRIAALYDKLAQGKHLSHPTPAIADNAGHETEAHGSVEGTSSVSSDDILARKMSTFPLIYYMPRIAALYDKVVGGKHTSHPMPTVDDNADNSMDNITFFFHEKEVHVGNIMNFYFPPAQSTPLGLLPRRVAESIPFSSSALPSVLSGLGIPRDSSLAATMELTLEMCEMPPHSVKEVQFCATSLEALVDGAVKAFGTRDISPMTSDIPYSGSPPLQPYTIQAVHPINSSSFLSCHYPGYPYTVYACHHVRSTRVYKMKIEGHLSGNVVNLVIVCHEDTSDWDPNYIAFKVLGSKPGGAPICHFMPYGNIIWSKKAHNSSV